MKSEKDVELKSDRERLKFRAPPRLRLELLLSQVPLAEAGLCLPKAAALTCGGGPCELKLAEDTPLRIPDPRPSVLPLPAVSMRFKPLDDLLLAEPVSALMLRNALVSSCIGAGMLMPSRPIKPTLRAVVDNL